MSAQSSMTYGVNTDEVAMERELKRFANVLDSDTQNSLRRMFHHTGMRQVMNNHYGAGRWIERSGK